MGYGVVIASTKHVREADKWVESLVSIIYIFLYYIVYRSLHILENVLSIKL